MLKSRGRWWRHAKKKEGNVLWPYSAEKIKPWPAPYHKKTMIIMWLLPERVEMDIPACNAGTAPLLSPRPLVSLRPGGGTCAWVRSFSCLPPTLLLVFPESFVRSLLTRKHLHSLVSTWWIFICVQSFCLKGICAGCFYPSPPFYFFFGEWNSIHRLL